MRIDTKFSAEEACLRMNGPPKVLPAYSSKPGFSTDWRLSYLNEVSGASAPHFHYCRPITDKNNAQALLVVFEPS
jgi:hypothetical protein